VTRKDRRDERDAQAARVVASRAVRRLELLEWVTLGVAALAATGGGALVAAVLSKSLGVGFRWTWVAASLLMFAVPALAALWKTRREERSLRVRSTIDEDGSDV
jgi:uncharacterized membrane protein YqjE